MVVSYGVLWCCALLCLCCAYVVLVLHVSSHALLYLVVFRTWPAWGAPWEFCWGLEVLDELLHPYIRGLVRAPVRAAPRPWERSRVQYELLQLLQLLDFLLITASQITCQHLCWLLISVLLVWTPGFDTYLQNFANIIPQCFLTVTLTHTHTLTCSNSQRISIVNENARLQHKPKHIARRKGTGTGTARGWKDTMTEIMRNLGSSLSISSSDERQA